MTARTNGEGSLYPRHKPGCPRPTNGKGDPSCKCPWVGALVLAYRDGKPYRKRVTANTRSGAATKLRKVREEWEARTLTHGKVPTVEQWMNHWLDNIAARKVAESTMDKSYRQKTRDYIIPLLGSHRIDRLTSEHIEAAYEQMADVGNPMLKVAKPLAANTIHQTHAILRRSLKVAVQRRHLRENPADSNHMDAPPARVGEVVPMTLPEVRSVLDTCKGKRNAARWSVALALGLRQGESLGLPWWDPAQPERGGVDLDAGIIRVRRALKRLTGKGLVYGPVKSEASKRDLVIPDEMLPVFKAHRKSQNVERLEAGSAWEDNDLVFCQVTGKPLDPSRDYQSWQALLKAAGVRKYRLHDARHSAATLLMLQNVQPRVVQGILGHSQISITMRYEHAVDELKRDAASRMGAALWG